MGRGLGWCIWLRICRGVRREGVGRFEEMGKGWNGDGEMLGDRPAIWALHGKWIASARECVREDMLEQII